MADQPEKEQDKFSLVLLLSELWGPLQPEVFADIVRRTFKKKIPVGDAARGDATEFVMGEFPQFFIQFDGFLFAIFTIPQPYFDDPEAAAEGLRELRARKAVVEHGAHISVSLFTAPDDADQDTQERLIGRMIAGLGWSDATLAVFCPTIGQVRVWEKSLRKMLKEEHPLTAFQKYSPSTKTTPVVAVEAEDTEWAKAESQRRWPEFVAAFERRQPDAPPFLVKAPCKDGEHIEFMWMTVLKLEDGVIEAKLENEPVEVKRFKRGQKLRLKAHLVVDWVFKDGNRLAGNFTEEALERRQARIAAEAAGADAIEEVEEKEPSRPQLPVRKKAAAVPPQPAKSNTGLIVSLVVAGVVVLIAATVGLMAALGVFSGGRGGGGGDGGQIADGDIRPPRGDGRPKGNGGEGPRGGGASEHVTRDFVRDLVDGNFDAAYNRTTPAFRGRVSSLQLRAVAATGGNLVPGSAFDGKPKVFRFAHKETPDEAVTVVSTNNRKGPYAFTLRTVRHDTGWWVDDFSVGAPPVYTEKTSSVVEAVANGFVGRLVEGDHVAAYAQTTRDYQQKRQSLEGFRATMATCKLFDGQPPNTTRSGRKELMPGKVYHISLRGLQSPTSLSFRIVEMPDGCRVENVWPGANKRPEPGPSTAGHVANLFTGALRDGDVEAAYGLLNAKAQAKYPIDRFREGMVKAFGNNRTVDQLRGQVSAAEGVHPVSATGQKGPIVFTFRTRREADGWWVADLNIPLSTGWTCRAQLGLG